MAKKKQRPSGRYRGRNNNQNNQNNQNNRNANRPGGGQRGGQRRRYGYNDNRRERDYDYQESGDPLPLTAGSGVLEMHPNGYGFLRNPATNFTRERTDPFVPGTMIEKFGLREGVLITAWSSRIASSRDRG